MMSAHHQDLEETVIEERSLGCIASSLKGSRLLRSKNLAKEYSSSVEYWD
jgi:hypothetical protein